jgi:hypothetical protein
VKARAAPALVALAVASACEQDPKKAGPVSVPRERNEVVQAGSAPAAPAPSAPAAVSVGAAAAPRSIRQSCQDQVAKPARDLPRKSLAQRQASGARALPLPIPAGQWTWMNLWAAWCAPCKEEIPRLRAFASRLAQSSKPTSLWFVSLDDDERQLEQFLSAQPEDGVRSTYWLREGHERDDWLLAVGIARDAALPVQILVDPRGKVRCIVNGAIEDKDYAEVAAVLSTP